MTWTDNPLAAIASLIAADMSFHPGRFVADGEDFVPERGDMPTNVISDTSSAMNNRLLTTYGRLCKVANYMTGVLSPKQIGKNLKALREKSGLRAVEIARALRVTRQHIYQLESGNKKLTVERLQQFGRVFKVEPEKILGNGKKPA